MKKLRITGGEPLVRSDIVPLVRALGEIPGIEDMSLTTNATLLASIAKELYEFVSKKGYAATLSHRDMGRR